MSSKRKSNDAGNSSKPKRSRKVLPISEKVLILDLIQQEKKSYAEVAKMYGKNESSIREVVRNEKKIRSSYAVAPQTAKVTSKVRDEVLIKMETALNLWVEDMNRKCMPIDGSMLRQKALSLYKDFKKESTEKKYTKPFTASRGWLHNFRKRHNLKNIKISGEAVPETVNVCWKNLWSEVANDFKGFPAIDGDVKKILRLAKQVGEEGFANMIDEVAEHIEEHREVLTYEELEELVKSSTEEEEDEVEVAEAEPEVWTLEKLNEVFQIAQTLKEKIMGYDPMMERSIKVIGTITEALEPLQEMFDDLKKKKQLPITMSLQKVEKQSMSTVNNPQPSTSSALDTIQPSKPSIASPVSAFNRSASPIECDQKANNLR